MTPKASAHLCALTLLTLCSLAHAGVDQLFEIDTSGWQPQPQSMHLAGDFNGWSTSATPMQVNGGRVWSVTLNLEEGEHHYKFVSDAGKANQKWLNDPKADPALNASDGNGGMNSGVIAGVDAAKMPPPQPNHINEKAVAFDVHDRADFDLSNGTLRLRARAQANDVQRATFRVWARSPGTGSTISTSVRDIELHRMTTERGLDVFGAAVPWNPDPQWTQMEFYLGFTDGTFVEAPIVRGEIPAPSLANTLPPAWTRDAVWYQIFVERFRNADPSNDPGDFAKYERLVPWNGDWWQAQPGETPGDENFYNGAGNVWNRRYGGDLQGVIEKLPYLRSVGINAIYLNPIFEAESMHKYDTADFRHVDDNFGARDSERGTGLRHVVPENQNHVPEARATEQLGNRAFFNRDGSPLPASYRETNDPATWRWTKSDLIFLDLARAAHEQGFRVVLDGVFNHVGRAHPFFMDVLRNGKRSPYANWFDITDWGDEKNWRAMPDPFDVHGKPGGIQWNAWDKHNGWLPVLKKDPKTGLAHGPREHVLAVAKRWLDPDGDPKTNDGADGWRLDVPGDIPHPFWLDFRTACREANPESYIVGEIWSPAQAWINNGDQFDAVMNYQFAMACQEFFVNDTTQIKPSAFNDKLVKLWFMYPMANVLAMQNLFDSHDTDRVASMIVNPDRPYDGQNRPQDNARENPTPYSARKPTDVEWARLLQMVAFQHTFAGAPMTYYGNEFGMWSPDDPSNRQPLPWDDKGPYAEGVGLNKTVFDGFQRYAAIRSALAPLRSGSFYPVKIDDEANVYAFARELGDEHVYVVLNRSSESRSVQLTGIAPGEYVDYASAKSVRIEMPMIEIATKRPVPIVNADAVVEQPINGQFNFNVPAYGVMILATPSAR